MRAKVEDKDCYVALYLKKQGFSNNEIAKQLNRHHKTIGNILKRYQETGSIKHRHRSGRPKI
jgi:transposase